MRCRIPISFFHFPFMGCHIPLLFFHFLFMGCRIPILVFHFPFMGCRIPILFFHFPFMGCRIPILFFHFPFMECGIPILLFHFPWTKCSIPSLFFHFPELFSVVAIRFAAGGSCLESFSQTGPAAPDLHGRRRALRASRACTSVKLRFIPSSLNIATWNPAFWISSALEVPANPQPPTGYRPPIESTQCYAHRRARATLWRAPLQGGAGEVSGRFSHPFRMPGGR